MDNIQVPIPAQAGSGGKIVIAVLGLAAISVATYFIFFYEAEKLTPEKKFTRVFNLVKEELENE